MTADLARSFADTFSHHVCQMDDVQLHYVMGGSGEPLLLLHGWPQTWFEWRRVMPALAGRYTVIAPDLRGLGDSSRPVVGYDLRTLSGDIRGLVEHLGLGPIRLVGHDLGGPVAGTISRRISHRGQFFPQFVRRQLEELAEAHLGHLQPHQPVRRLIFAAAGPEPTQVPVQTLQVQ